METNYLAKLLHLLVTFFLVLLVLTLITLPFLVNKYVESVGILSSRAMQLTVFLYLTGIPFLVLLVMVKKLCKNVLQNKAFSLNSITCLHVSSISALVDGLIYAAGTFTVFRNLLSLTLMVAAFMICLVSLLLAQLMKVAIKIKEENDLTI